MASVQRPPMCHISSNSKRVRFELYYTLAGYDTLRYNNALMYSLCFQIAIEEQDEGAASPFAERGYPEGGEDIEGLPWHHAQLVLLYGRHVADDIIHPKMETQQKTKMNPKLFNQEGLFNFN